MDLYINSDGGARGNPGNAACAFIVKDEKGNVIYKWSKYLGVRTNNQAEYMGVIMALQWLDQQKDKINPSIIIYRLDSELVAKQIKGEYKVKSKLLLPYLKRVKNLLNQLPFTFSIEHVLREFNAEADCLVNHALDNISAV